MHNCYRRNHVSIRITVSLVDSSTVRFPSVRTRKLNRWICVRMLIVVLEVIATLTSKQNFDVGPDKNQNIQALNWDLIFGLLS